MRICFITTIFPPDIGGPATYVFNLATCLKNRGWEIKVLTYGDSGCSNMYHFPVRRIKKGFLLLRVFKMGLVILKERSKFDVFYSNGGFSSALPLILSSPFLNKKIAVKVTGDYAWEQARNRGWTNDDIDDFQRKKYCFKIWFFKKIQSIVVTKARIVIVPSKYLLHMVKGWGANVSRVKVIYNACNIIIDKRELVVRREPIIFSAGRLVSWKGFNCLIEAFFYLVKKHKELKLIIAGDGPEKFYLAQKINKLGLEKKAFLVGSLNKKEMAKYYKKSSCFVLYSGYEGLSHVLLEAMSYNLPIVASKKGGNVELLKNGVNGLLVNWYDCRALEKALDSVLYVKNAISKPGLLNKREFLWETLVKRTIEALNSTNL